eukprot:GGOE01003362.1.p1 GENE.GGOE01003362.1~~GGOE01003362.1.p1  ORF type:complete len:314 (+),score=3.01 GGOE01003362.1:75-1016(+)
MEHFGCEAKFPGVFVRHKGHKDGAPVTALTKKFENLGRAAKVDSELDSPKSNQSEDCAVSSCTSTTSSVQAPPCNGLATSDGVLTAPEIEVPTDMADGGKSDFGKLRRSKRKKSKDKTSEENTALDPVRYKTKMCKNWQQQEKCPYGPRCLFAHGTKEMRTYSINSSAINTASNSTSPERQFYTLGHFPNFMPVPFENEDQKEPLQEEPEKSMEVTSKSETTSGQYTHSPYSCTPAPYGTQEPQPAVPDCRPPPSILGPMQDPYFFGHRAYPPVFPQMPYPSECALYPPQFPPLPPYHMAPEMYSMPFFHSVR